MQMDIMQETQQLRIQLRTWARHSDWALRLQYEFLPLKLSPYWYQRVIQKTGCLLRAIGINRTTWHVGLKHASFSPDAKPLLFWSEGLPPKKVRAACTGAKKLLRDHPHFLPILLTDVPDFSFYSRLHWLVEYLPRLGEDAEYYNRKRCYLAWRYRNALALPLAAGLATQKEFAALVSW